MSLHSHNCKLGSEPDNQLAIHCIQIRSWWCVGGGVYSELFCQAGWGALPCTILSLPGHPTGVSQGVWHWLLVGGGVSLQVLLHFALCWCCCPPGSVSLCTANYVEVVPDSHGLKFNSLKTQYIQFCLHSHLKAKPVLSFCGAHSCEVVHLGNTLTSNCRMTWPVDRYKEHETYTPCYHKRVGLGS